MMAARKFFAFATSATSWSPASTGSTGSTRTDVTLLLTLSSIIIVGFCVAPSPALSPPNTPLPAAHASQATAHLQQCREGCYKMFAVQDALCLQNHECLMCLDECIKPSAQRTTSKWLRETWPLTAVSVVQQDSLVLVEVAWQALKLPSQCLVTWEVSGGGLMGNLLTESVNVQLSLWPDTKYRVQVTCKSKVTGSMSRSQPLMVDTSSAITSAQYAAAAATVATATGPDKGSDSSEDTLPISAIEPNFAEEGIAPVFPYGDDDDDGDGDDNGNDGDGDNNNNNTNENDREAEDDNDDDVDNLALDHASATQLSQHTNFIFNWHTRKSHLGAAVEPVPPVVPDFSSILQTPTDMRKPLLFGVMAGTLLLALVCVLYVCLAKRTKHLSSDKAALLEDEEEQQQQQQHQHPHHHHHHHHQEPSAALESKTSSQAYGYASLHTLPAVLAIIADGKRSSDPNKAREFLAQNVLRV